MTSLKTAFSCFICLTVVLITNGQIIFHTAGLSGNQAYFTQQAYPWGYSYSFSEIGKSHKAANIKTAATKSAAQASSNVIIPVTLGISLAPRLTLTPLPLLRKIQATSPTTTVIEVGNEDDKSTETPMSTSETSTTLAPETTTISSEAPTTIAQEKIVKVDEPDSPKPGFYFGHLTPPLTFSYGFATVGHPNPLPIPHLPLLAFHFNSSDISTTPSSPKKDDEKMTEADMTTTGSPTTEMEKEEIEDNEITSEKSSEVKSESFSEPTTHSSFKDEEDDPNLETETISPLRTIKEKNGKLKEESSSNNEESTITTENMEVTSSQSSTTEGNTNTDSSTSEITSKSNVILISNGNKSEFSYSVKDETTFDEKSHQEERDGDSVKGKYSVVEPDGALRTVTYVADADGFKADVVRKESYAKPFPVFQNSVNRAPGAIQSLSSQNVLSYYYNGFHFPPPKPQVVRNFGYGYYILPTK